MIFSAGDSYIVVGDTVEERERESVAIRICMVDIILVHDAHMIIP